MKASTVNWCYNGFGEDLASGSADSIKAELNESQEADTLLLDGKVIQSSGIDFIKNDFKSLELVTLYNLTDAVELLLNRSCVLRNKRTSRAFDLAVWKCHKDVATMFLIAGIEYNGRNQFNETILFVSACGNNSTLTEILIEGGSDLNECTRSGTALHVAAARNYDEVLRVLVKHGCDLNIRDRDGFNALILAILNENLKNVKLLVQCGCSINIEELYSTLCLAKQLTKYPEIERIVWNECTRINMSTDVPTDVPTDVLTKIVLPASTIEWAMWANEHVLLTGYILGTFSILTIILQFSLWPIGIYGLILAVFIIIIEYPRSGRIVKKSKPRPLQKYPSVLLTKLGPLTRNYFIRFVLYILLSLPCLFLISTITPAISLFIGAGAYGLAALYQEQWKPVEPKTTDDAVPMPTRPPPRAHAYNTLYNA
ncbi:unnamed protein product [Rotaria socialis]|uniref:Cytochrome b-245 light chain n=2 Tax=Rotaria socialis TaxID=392032 RepID=A0A821CH77_9BILA|nr:unnamed protein product [Rotaria socialis]